MIYLFCPKQQTGKIAIEEIDIDVPNIEMEEDKTSEVEIDDIDKSGDTIISFAVEDTGRANPFLPPSDSYVVTASLSKLTNYDLTAPPESITDNSDASKVVSTKVSGIMYDINSPSAILNIEGSDYLVRSGDYINNYKVLAIGKEIVTVQLGSNIYKARVGEMLSDAQINYNNVYDLQNRFGGAKR